MSFINTDKSEKLLELSGEYSLDFYSLIRLLDSPTVKISYDTDPTEAVVGEVLYFIRTLEGNKVLRTQKYAYLIPCKLYSDNNVKLFEPETTLNDFVLLSGRNILANIFTTTSLKTLVFNTFPIPFGIYYDPEKNYNVVVMQMCVRESELQQEEGNIFVPVGESSLPDYIKEHFKYTKD